MPSGWATTGRLDVVMVSNNILVLSPSGDLRKLFM